jgi:hypothetical protein
MIIFTQLLKSRKSYVVRKEQVVEDGHWLCTNKAPSMLAILLRFGKHHEPVPIFSCCDGGLHPKGDLAVNW